MSSELEYRTTDMAEVAFLLTCGYAHAKMEKPGRSARWVYNYAQGNGFMDRVDEYRQGEAWVEPKEFMLKVGLVREELYRFLGVKAQRIND